MRGIPLAHDVGKAFLGLLIAVAAWLPQQAQAQTTVVDNLAPSGGASSVFNSTTWIGFRFQVGPADQRISEWTAVADSFGVATDVRLRLFELDSVTNSPSRELASVMLPWAVGVDNTYSAGSLGAVATTTLSANTKYGLVLGEPTVSMLAWPYTVTAPTFSGGFSAAGNMLVTTNGGTTWGILAGPQHLRTQLKVVAALPPSGAAVAVPTLEVWSLSALGLLVAGFGARRMRRGNAR